MEYLVIDSLSHAWAGEGGLLEVQGNIAKRTGNSYTAWRDVTPQHNKLVESILQCDMHIAITLRTKTEYVIEDTEKGKKAPKKMGTAPIFRDGIEYEVTTFFDIDLNHTASVTKDRTMMFDGQFFTITPQTGTQIYAWLTNNGTTQVQPSVKPAAKQEPPVELSLMERVDQTIKAHCAGMDAAAKGAVAEEIKQITGGIANYKTVTDDSVLRALYERFKGDAV